MPPSRSDPKNHTCFFSLPASQPTPRSVLLLCLALDTGIHSCFTTSQFLHYSRFRYLHLLSLCLKRVLLPETQETLVRLCPVGERILDATFFRQWSLKLFNLAPVCPVALGVCVCVSVLTNHLTFISSDDGMVWLPQTWGFTLWVFYQGICEAHSEETTQFPLAVPSHFSQDTRLWSPELQWKSHYLEAVMLWGSQATWKGHVELFLLPTPTEVPSWWPVSASIGEWRWRWLPALPISATESPSSAEPSQFRHYEAERSVNLCFLPTYDPQNWRARQNHSLRNRLVNTRSNGIMLFTVSLKTDFLIRMGLGLLSLIQNISSMRTDLFGLFIAHQPRKC